MLNLSVVIFPLFINFRTLCYRVLARMKYPIPNIIHYYPHITHDPYEKSAKCISNCPDCNPYLCIMTSKHPNRKTTPRWNILHSGIKKATFVSTSASGVFMVAHLNDTHPCLNVQLMTIMMAITIFPNPQMVKNGSSCFGGLGVLMATTLWLH